ncbi:MAG: phosphatidate cytidylyltransferase [Chloroflexota bacterium]
MITRIIFGLSAIPFVLLPLWMGGVWTLLFALTVGLVAGYEYCTLILHSTSPLPETTTVSHPMPHPMSHPVPDSAIDKKNQSHTWHFYALVLLWISLFIVQSWQPNIIPLELLIVGLLLTTLIYALFQPQAASLFWFSATTGVLYIGFILGRAMILAALPHGFWWLILVLLVAWMNDTTAYFVGSFLGKHRLWPRISPNKTWEGSVGGWIGGACMGAFVTWITPVPLSIWMGFSVGFIGGIFALFGDLAVSVLKRQAQAKDTGAIFPGHGGVLDRLDSILFVLPFIWIVAMYLS